MKVLFVVYHPVDPYIVFETAKRIESEGGKSFFVIVEKEGIIKSIVDSYSFDNKVIGTAKKSFLGKLINSITIVFGLSKIIEKFKPDKIFSPSSPYTSLTCRFNRLPLICWEDTETASFNYKFSHRRVNSFLVIQSFFKELRGDNVIRFNGYKELAYLHPKYFKPDVKVVYDLGLSENDKIVLMRFSALHAMHDRGLKSVALTSEDKLLNFIKEIQTKYKAKVLISTTERELNERFEQYKLKIRPADYANLLAYCSLYIGEGTTTACEAGVLGVPWIALRDKPLGYLIDQEENYGLGFRIDNLDSALKKADELLSVNNKSEWFIKKERLINDKIDVSAFLFWFINEYPKSHSILKENPSYQNNFLN